MEKGVEAGMVFTCLRHGVYLLEDTLHGEGQACPQEATSTIEDECHSRKT